MRRGSLEFWEGCGRPAAIGSGSEDTGGKVQGWWPNSGANQRSLETLETLGISSGSGIRWGFQAYKECGFRIAPYQPAPRPRIGTRHIFRLLLSRITSLLWI